MRKTRNLLLLLMALVPFLTSCNKEDIVFDYELPQFELRNDAVLLEVIMPQGTTADDYIYIAGDFNGGQAAAAGDARWQLEKAADNDVKWGIYLYPEDFVSGKTLADGFFFVSKSQGIERTLKGDSAVHKLSVGTGTRTNVTVSRWNSYFVKPDEPGETTHDGYTVYVLDNTGWDALSLYAWSDANPELFGGWPGKAPTGTVDIKGFKYKYFDTGEGNKGLVYNLIFNNTADKQFDGPQSLTLDRDIYLELSAGGWKEIDPDAMVKHDGYAIFIEDRSGWAESTIYAWGDGIPELFGAWPGAKPTGTVTLNGVSYKYYDTGEANKGMTYNLIMNNNNGGAQFDLSTVTLDRDYYFRITDTGGEEVNPDDNGTSGK